jgi:hypothetical protein
VAAAAVAAAGLPFLALLAAAELFEAGVFFLDPAMVGFAGIILLFEGAVAALDAAVGDFAGVRLFEGGSGDFAGVKGFAARRDFEAAAAAGAFEGFAVDQHSIFSETTGILQIKLR